MTCSNDPGQPIVPTNTPALQFVQSVANADTIVALESTGIDVITATISPLTPPTVMSPSNCKPNVVYSAPTFIDFGVGPVTARQLLVSTNGTNVAVLPNAIPNVLVAAIGGGPTVIPLAAGGTGPTSGGMTPDGNNLWIGVAGTNTVDHIDLTANSDSQQVATSFKKSDGSAAPPDLLALRPQ